jgi:two-component system cell cycle response regulator DivK
MDERLYRSPDEIRGTPHSASWILLRSIQATSLSGDDAKAFEAGCDAYISKPFSPRALLAKVREYLP